MFKSPFSSYSYIPSPYFQGWCLSSLLHQSLSACLPSSILLHPSPDSFFFDSPLPSVLFLWFLFPDRPETQRERERSPRHVRSMAMIAASESQKRKLHGCVQRQQISYFQEALILISPALISSTDDNVEREGGWRRDGISPCFLKGFKPDRNRA